MIASHRGVAPRSTLAPSLGLLVLSGLAAFAPVLSACRGEKPTTSGERKATPTGTATGTSTAAKALRAGVVFDIGGVDDKSFNEMAYRGLMRAQSELGVEVAPYQPSQPADRKTGLRQFAAKGYDVIFGVGFIFTDEIVTMARDFPDLKFVCIDMVEREGQALPPNLVGVRFREEQGSFLAGAAAALVSRTKKVGFIGGMNVPLIHKFEAGYRAGVHHVAPDVQVVVNYAGDTPRAFQDPETGKNRALEQFKSGVDVIFHASGKTGLGVFQAAKEEKKLAIGVDADQGHEAPGHVLTSMVKHVDTAVFEMIKAVKEGRFQSGRVVFGLAEEGVGIVLDERNRAFFSPEALAKLDALKAELIAGKIEVPTTR